MNITQQEWEIYRRVLQHVADDPSLIDHDERAKALIAKIHRQGKKGQRLSARREKGEHDRILKSGTGRWQAATPSSALNLPIDAASPHCGARQLQRAVPCYICKQAFTDIHFFYHALCPDCAKHNYARRLQRADLRGRVALITGGRIKIGYQLALRLLRDGARVILTTRFPTDAASRFSAEPDFSEWQERLVIYGLDLRQLAAIEAFINHLLESETFLDILIHNAAQTVKRPLAYYRGLLESSKPLQWPEAAASVLAPAFNSANPSLPQVTHLLETLAEYPQLPIDIAHFPAHEWDAEGQPLDKRPDNSWSLRLHQVSALEMVEVQLVNAIAPFLLNSRLKPLLLQSPFKRRFIINVSAMEGQFNRLGKTVFHPHTNMAKAALNMMTRTSAADYAVDGIYMNSVDTGWITDENPYPKKTLLHEQRGFVPPLDVVDGMARIYDPIVQGIEDNAEPPYGHFLKDYVPHSW
jgi:NAD(P)-dependent dehydrogenase (short-subunit alcohol dehydrogenase family)